MVFFVGRGSAETAWKDLCLGPGVGFRSMPGGRKTEGNELLV